MSPLATSACLCLALLVGLGLCSRSRPAGALITLAGAGGVAALAGSDPVCGEASAFGHVGRCAQTAPLVPGAAVALICGCALVCAWLREPLMAPLLLAGGAVLAADYVRGHRPAAGELDPAALPGAIAGGIWFVLLAAACLAFWSFRETALRPRTGHRVRSARHPEVPLAAEIIH